VPVAAVVAVVVAVVPVSASAPVGVAEAAVEEAAVVVVLALLWLGTPNHRKVERYRLPQALQSICRGLDWCQRLLQPLFRRASLRPVLPASWSSLRCSPSRTSRALRTPFVCFASFLPPSKNRKFSA